ncbi:MAG: cache domain-containing protein [Ignavibacteria bacterium]|nr:cache domain-containing protein [Ignavibacteria bacterium]
MKSFFLLLTAALITLSGCTKNESVSAPEIDNLSWNKQIAAAYVHSYATAIGEAALKLSNDSTLIDFIRKSINPISFYADSSGYFYVYDYNCVNIAHARQKDIEGQNLYDYTDTKGKYVVRELAVKAQSGGGYVEFYWIKPGETGEKKKLGYVEPIPNTNYFIGSGVYLE